MINATEIKKGLFTRGRVIDCGLSLEITDRNYGTKQIYIYDDGRIRIKQIFPKSYRNALAISGKLVDFLEILTVDQFNEIVRLREIIMGKRIDVDYDVAEDGGDCDE